MAGNALSASAMSPIVGAVYDCVIDPARWPSTLDSICRAAQARLATLAVLDTVEQKPRFSVACGEASLLGPLISDYADDVPFYSALPLMDIDVPFTVDMIYALQGDGARESWLSSRIVREWVVPNGLDDFFWTVLVRQPTRAASLVVMTDRERRQITPGELSAMSLLAPHVRRAVVIGDLFEKERAAADMFRGVLDTLAHAVIVVARDLRILYANPSAEAFLTDAAVASIRGGHLSFAYSPANGAVERAVALGVDDEFALGPSGINVPLVRAHAPAVAHVMPLARREPEMRVATPAAAAIFIAEAGAVPLAALDAVAALFGLTAAEKRVAGHVAAGRTRREIALASGVSDETVKSQLSAIFDKTETGDRRELQLLLRELSPPVRLS